MSWFILYRSSPPGPAQFIFVFNKQKPTKRLSSGLYTGLGQRLRISIDIAFFLSGAITAHGHSDAPIKKKVKNNVRIQH